MASEVGAQSAIERYAWQDARTFEPISRTATAITGAITLSGNPEFASEGSTMSLSFANGAAVKLTSVGASWRTWDLSGEKQTAEAFVFSEHPGQLQNGNTLCGGEDSGQELYAVFYEHSLFNLPPTLNLALFEATEPPFDINSPGLCGTYSYEIGGKDEMAISVTETTSVGSWIVRARANPIDDTRTVTLSLEAKTGTSRLGDAITFVARCQSSKTEAYVIWGEYLGNDSNDVYSDWKKVTVRIGEKEARQERWGVSTDHKATFAPSWAGNLLKELLDEDRLVLQTVPYGENPVTAIFDISGLRTVLGELAGTCNWRL